MAGRIRPNGNPLTMRGRMWMLAIDISQRVPRRAALLSILIVASSILEGITIALLFPLLRRSGVGADGESGILNRLTEQLLDAVGLGGSVGGAAVAVVCTVVAQQSVFVAQAWLGADVQHRFVSAWRIELFSGAMRARWPFFLSASQGSMINTIVGETFRLGGAMYLLIQLVAATVVALVYALVALLMSWQVTLGLLAIGALVALGTRRILRRGHLVGSSITRWNADLQTLSVEHVAGAKLVKAAAAEAAAVERFSDTVDRLRLLFRWDSFQPNLIRAIFELSAITALVLVLAFGTRVLDVDAATILVVLAAFARLYPRLSLIQQNLQQLNTYLSAILSVHELAAAEDQSAEWHRGSTVPAAVVQHRPVDIKLDHVDVALSSTLILRDISLSLPAGTLTAVVGPSGAGKTTLVDAVLGLAEVATGQIMVDGCPLENLDITRWRRSVGYVQQDTYLFHASVAENIALGRPEVDRGAIEEAAQRARIHNVVEALPAGYDTLVGDRGIRLSGGQRQRIGLARALAGRPSLLLLDEATSALDTESERLVFETIGHLKGSVTMVFIAHRLASARRADQVVVLDEGRLVEVGRWEELVGAGGRLSELWADHGA